MKKGIIRSLLLALSLLLVVCSEESQTPSPQQPDTPTPNPGEELQENTYRIQGEEFAFRSVLLSMDGENPLLYASPEEGLTTPEAFVAAREYFFVAISPRLNGVEFDLMKEERLFTLISTLVGAELESVAPSLREEIRSGKCCFAYDKGSKKVVVKAEMVLADGGTLAVHIVAKGEIALNENIYIREQEEKPLRAAFYDTTSQEGIATLYFTPAHIYYFEEIELATSYLYLSVDRSLLTGETFALENLTAEQLPAMGCVDHLSSLNSWELTDKVRESLNGEMAILEEAEGRYTASLGFTCQGVRYAIYFKGTAISVEEQMPVPEQKNLFTYAGEEQSILGACLRCVEEVYHLELQLADQRVVTLTLPVRFADGNPRGFSQSADLTLRYGDRIFSKANGDSGTITLLLDEERSEVKAEFTNYKDCELFYEGSVEIEQ